jgi:dynamin 1-like protein
MSTGSSPPGGSARETFLNYFFGQNGPGPIAGSSVDRTSVHAHPGHHPGSQQNGPGYAGVSAAEPTHIVPVGRDMSSGENTLMTSGLLAGKRGMDGNNAAYDMKSLGRHIEAVSFPSFPLSRFLVVELIVDATKITPHSFQETAPN